MSPGREAWTRARACVLAAATELAERRDESAFTHLQDALTAIDALDDFLGDGEVTDSGHAEPTPPEAPPAVIDLGEAKARLIERRRADRRRQP